MAGFVLMAGLATLVLTQQNHPWIQQIKTKINDFSIELIATASIPANWLDHTLENTKHFIITYQENTNLKEQNNNLQKWKNYALSLEAENKQLRNLLKLDALPPLGYQSARVIGNSASTLNHSILLHIPSSHNLQTDMAVVTNVGLVGRIENIGEKSARVLLITDANSRIPVITQTSRIKAILMGNNTDTPTLGYLPDNAKTIKGEKIVTIDDGNIFPAGIPVGIVTSTDSNPQINLYTHRNNLEFVQIATKKGQ